MIPIYEQSSGRGIGHGRDTFLVRFDEICEEHVAKGRAKAFAFIFYDFSDRAMRRILADQGAFAQLDRLSGSELSVFYLHGGTKWVVQDFNSHFFSKLGIEDDVKLPCVVFFRVSDGAVESVEVAELQHADLIHGFKELYGAIESYINGRAAEPSAQSTAIRWMKAGGKFLSLEAFRAAIKAALEGFF